MGKEPITQTHPHLVQEWIDDKNPSVVLAGSGYKAQWKCQKDESHVWSAVVKNRVKGSGCPYCSGTKVLVGKNDLATTHPHLTIEWGEKNTCNPTQVSAGSNKKIQWQCSHNSKHIWHTTVYSRSKGSGCPYCAGQRVTIGINDLSTTHPKLTEEWSQNNTLKPVEVFALSNKKVEWICKKDSSHVWNALVSSRGKKDYPSGCPFCSGQKAIANINDLSTTHPKIASEWNDEKDVLTVSPGSDYEAQWKCGLGHEWTCSVYKRTRMKRDCDVCNNRKVLKGFNDLATTHPELIKEWDESNSSFPHEFIAGSHERVSWVCQKNPDHKWKTMIANRSKLYLPTGCPNCFAKKFISRAEDEIYDYIRKVLPESITVLRSVRNVIPPNELDIYIPDLNLAIEYNGIYWHSEAAGKDKWYHYDKYMKCKEKRVKLFQIWEDDYKNNSDLVKRMINHKIGVNNEGTVFARKTNYVKVGKVEAETFLDKNHLQKMNYASTYFGLRTKEKDLICLLGIQKIKKDNKYDIEVSRFAVKGNVPGGFSKLLKNTLKDERYFEAENIVSYSHNDHSWGNLYEKNGFKKTHDGTPGYFYIKHGFLDREFRRNYTIDNFKKNPNLIFENNLSEKELAGINNLHRIWDSGSTKWVKPNFI